MTNAVKIMFILFLIIVMSILIIYSFLKYENKDNETAYSETSLVYNIDKGKNTLFYFLDFLTNFNWFNNDLEKISESYDIDYEPHKYIENIEGSEEIRDINLFNLIKDSVKITNWTNIWQNYWNKQTGWIRKELQNIVK